MNKAAFKVWRTDDSGATSTACSPSVTNPVGGTTRHHGDQSHQEPPPHQRRRYPQSYGSRSSRSRPSSSSTLGCDANTSSAGSAASMMSSVDGAPARMSSVDSCSTSGSDGGVGTALASGAGSGPSS